jgi:hypothetical protein
LAFALWPSISFCAKSLPQLSEISDSVNARCRIRSLLQMKLEPCKDAEVFVQKAKRFSRYRSQDHVETPRHWGTPTTGRLLYESGCCSVRDCARQLPSHCAAGEFDQTCIGAVKWSVTCQCGSGPQAKSFHDSSAWCSKSPWRRRRNAPDKPARDVSLKLRRDQRTRRSENQTRMR